METKVQGRLSCEPLGAQLRQKTDETSAEKSRHEVGRNRQ
jgi:hypothetical protein